MTTGSIAAVTLSGLFALVGTILTVVKEVRLAKATNQREDFKVLHDRTVEQLQRVEARLKVAEEKIERLTKEKEQADLERFEYLMMLRRWQMWYENGGVGDPPSLSLSV